MESRYKVMLVEQLVITTAITACISGVVGSVVASIVTATKTAGVKAIESDKAMHEGMKLLLMDKASHLTKEAVAAGYISLEGRAFIHDVTRVARRCGANGESHEIDEIVNAIPISVNG